MGKKGHVLVQVLITSVIVSIMAAGLMQLVMLRYTVMSRGAEGATKKAQATAAFNTLMVEWNVPGSGGRCSNQAGWNCGGFTDGRCNCTCTKAGEPTVRVGVQPGGGVNAVNECPISVDVP